jgi:hypothetical protein
VPPRRRPWLFIVLLSVSALALPYSCAGYFMAASLTTTSLGRDPHWQQVGLAYLLLMALSAVGLVVAVVVLYRRATRREPDAGAGHAA